MTSISVKNPKNQMQAKAPVSNAASPSLGIHAESSSQRSNQLRNRYKLLRTAAALLPNERIAKCSNHVAPNAKFVVARYSPSKKTACYSNLERCESNSCPACAYVRAEKDRKELAIAIAGGLDDGMFPVMMTFTIRHDKGDELTALRAAVASAFDDTFSGRWYQEFKSEWAVVGKIKKWETKRGYHGWHPHLHILFFMREELNEKTREKIENQIRERWQQKIEKAGFDVTYENGANVKIGDSAVADYISKVGREPLEREWGVESEMTLAQMKKGKVESLTPFELLAAAAGVQEPLERFMCIEGIFEPEDAKKRAGVLYCEYFAAFKGRPLLYWGKMWEILEVTELLFAFEKNNRQEENDSIDVLMIEPDEWRKVVRNEWRAELLTTIEGGDASSLRRWLRQRGIKAMVNRAKWEDDTG